jgi:hypothetical protein
MRYYYTLAAAVLTVQASGRKDEHVTMAGKDIKAHFVRGRKCLDLSNSSQLTDAVNRGWCHVTSESTICEVASCLYTCKDSGCRVVDLTEVDEGLDVNEKRLGTDYETFNVLVDYTDDTVNRSVDFVLQDLMSYPITGATVVSYDDNTGIKATSGYKTRFRETVVYGQNDMFKVNVKRDNSNTMNPRMRLDMGRKYDTPREFSLTFLHTDCGTPASINVYNSGAYCEAEWESWNLAGDFGVEGTVSVEEASRTFTACNGIEDPSTSTGSDGYTTFTIKLGQDTSRQADFGDYGITALAGQFMSPSWMAYMEFEVIKDGC